MEQRARSRDAADARHRTSAEVPGPHGDREVPGGPDRPVVSEVTARAGLHGDGKREVERRARAEAGDARGGIAEDVEEDRGRDAAQNATAFGPRLPALGTPGPRTPRPAV